MNTQNTLTHLHHVASDAPVRLPAERCHRECEFASAAAAAGCEVHTAATTGRCEVHTAVGAGGCELILIEECEVGSQQGLVGGPEGGGEDDIVDVPSAALVLVLCVIVFVVREIVYCVLCVLSCCMRTVGGGVISWMFQVPHSSC